MISFCIKMGSDETEPAKLQALVYDVLPWRKVPESDVRRSVSSAVTASVSVLLFKEIAGRLKRLMRNGRNCLDITETAP